MVSNQINAAGLREMKLATTTQKLERAYLESIQAANATQALEEKRRLRLRITLLQADNDDLHDQMERSETEALDRTAQRDDLMAELDVVAQSLEKAREDLRAKSRKIDSLQAEREGLRGRSTDSSKLLSEKVALSRELANLKPELEHLRSQLASNQSAVSEKQSLQRQLRAVEVELENERRVRSQSGDRPDTLMQELQARNEALESRLDSFRTKLKQTKELLAEAKKQRKKQDAEDTTFVTEEPEPEQKTNTKKRSFEEIEQDAVIGTPGDLPPNKRGRRVTTQPGEKSSFSITPFLNRTGNAAPESPASSPSKPRGSIAQAKTVTKKVPLTNEVKPRPKSLGTAAVSRNNARPPPAKRSAARSLSAPKLDKVVEEDDENHEGEDEAQKPEIAAVATSQPSTMKTAVDKPLVKKKKLLGKTIFDDDDEGPVRPMGLNFLGSKAPASSLNNLKVSSARFGAIAGKPVANFGAFSPLKKDRKVPAV